MKKSILIFLFAIFGIIADSRAQNPIAMSVELSLDTPLGSDITAYPNSVVYPGNYELNLRVRSMIHSGHYGTFSFSSERRVFGSLTWGTFSPLIAQFPNSGITNIYHQSAKTPQLQGTVYEYRVKVTFVATGGGTGTKTMYTPIRKATIIGVPTACFSMYNVELTENESSLFGPMPVKTICQNAVTINGSCSQFETGYHVRISEFNLASWTFVGPDLYNNWVSVSGTAPSFISLNALAASNGKVLTPGKLYLVGLSVGPVWNSAPPQFFRVVTCRQSGTDEINELQPADVPSDVEMDETVQEIKLYPNPVKDEVTISVNEEEKIVSYSIFDNSGNGVKKGEFTTESNEQKVNVAELRQGIYLLNIETNKQSYREKLMKE